MQSCWEASPEDRPTFSDLVNKLNSVLNQSNTSGYVDLYRGSRTTEEHSYIRPTKY